MKAFALLILVVLISGFANAQEPPKNAAEHKVLNIIKALPEFIAQNQYSLKTYKRSLYVEVDSDPVKDRGYYGVTVYTERPDIKKMNRWCSFEVDAKTYMIWIWDVAADKRLSLSQWRKQSN